MQLSQPGSQPVLQLVNQSANQPINQPASQPVSQSVSHSPTPSQFRRLPKDQDCISLLVLIMAVRQLCEPLDDKEKN